MKRKTLVQVTIELLAHRDRTITLQQIADDCKITKAWLSTLLCAEPVPHPSAVKIQTLYEYLSGKKLDY